MQPDQVDQLKRSIPYQSKKWTLIVFAVIYIVVVLVYIIREAILNKDIQLFNFLVIFIIFIIFQLFGLVGAIRENCRLSYFYALDSVICFAVNVLQAAILDGFWWPITVLAGILLIAAFAWAYDQYRIHDASRMIFVFKWWCCRASDNDKAQEK